MGLLWKSDRPVAETYTWQHITLTKDIHVSGGIRTRNPFKRAAADSRLSARGQQDLHIIFVPKIIFVFFLNDNFLSEIDMHENMLLHL
jgi:hypothetical protein